MLALNALSVFLSCYDCTLGNMAFICIIIICVYNIDLERLQEFKQFIKVFVFTRAEAIS